MRARKKPWAERELAANELLIGEPENFAGKWRLYFGNENPLFLEIGCGKGGFITKTAALNPDINFLALERERQVIVSGMRAAKNTGLKNIGFILSDVSGLEELFHQGEVNRLYINFCDPWPRRKKWAKRRLTHENFLNIYKRVLAPDARIFMKTDNLELFLFSIESFKANGWTLLNINYDLYKDGGADGDGCVKTEYEEKFTQANMPIYRLEAYIE